LRIGLIGSTGHVGTYGPALSAFKDLRLVAVSAAGPEETTGAFDHVPGLTVDTKRYDDPKRMLDAEKLDVVQICARPDRIPYLAQWCLERGIATMAEKPLAMDLAGLEKLYKLAQRSKVSLLPMHTQRGQATLAAMVRAIRAGEIGEPLIGFSQKTYKWGKSRPDFFKSRRTFPGIAPYIGVHALDWLHWMLGDVFTEVHGYEGTAAHPDYRACASQAAYTFNMKNGGSVALTLDYLRPETAPTHGDERVRIAGTKGVIETVLIEEKVKIISAAKGPRELPLPEQPDIFTSFVRHLKGDGPLPIGREEAFRITEVALKAQQAAESGKAVSLAGSPYVF
jgi:predicted dehydrogenase